jgi:serine/threonine-protein kinase Chk1
LNLSGREDDSIIHLCLSQPEVRKGDADDEVDCHFNQSSNDHHRRNPIFSFSQPAGERVDDFFIGSQLGSQAANPQSPPITRWVKRLTRFCVTTSVDKTIHELGETLDALNFQWKLSNSPGPCITVSTVDKRKNLLAFKAHVIEMGDRMVLLDFRLSRGDGLEFKRIFVRLRDLLSKIAWKGPMTWVV